MKALLFFVPVVFGITSCGQDAAGPSTPADLIVPDEYLQIQDAIDSAEPGDVVEIREGLYEEDVLIGTAVTLRLMPQARVIGDVELLKNVQLTAPSGMAFISYVRCAFADIEIDRVSLGTLIGEHSNINAWSSEIIEANLTNCVTTLANVSLGGRTPLAASRGELEVVNTILQLGWELDDVIAVAYNCLFPEEFSGQIPGKGNLFLPGTSCYLAPARGDLHLRPECECIDAGRDYNSIGERDADGLQRIVNAAPDIGAYEYQ